MRRQWIKGRLARYHALALAAAAFCWRRLMIRTTFIAITGSVGKTTAKDCLAGILARQAPTFKTWKTLNVKNGVPRMLLRVRPWHRYAVIEIGTDQAGMIRRSARLVRPHVAVVLAVAPVHLPSFQTVEAIAQEKADLIRYTRRNGVVVLNGDDPRVMEMATGRRRVVTFGTTNQCDLRGSYAESRWPGRLKFQASDGVCSIQVKTRLVGTHWMNSVLASLAVGRLFGVSLVDATPAIAEIEPFTARLQPYALPNGAVILRDEFNASRHSTDAAFRVLTQARAKRKWLVASDCADFGTNFRHRLRYLAGFAATSCDEAVFIGEKSTYAQRRAVEAGMDVDRIHAFLFLEQAASFLKARLGDGDLVLLKGQHLHHLSRICFALQGDVTCWKSNCTKRCLCDYCDEMGFRPQSPAASADRARGAVHARM